MSLPSIVIAIVALGLVDLPATLASDFECSGMGRRFCSGQAALTEECPDICASESCRQNRDEKMPQNGVYNYKDWDWVDLAKSGKYDNVYIDEDYLCLGSCWYKPWDARCSSQREPGGKRFCTAMDCRHDRYDDDSDGNRYVGCHKDLNGKRKRPFHKPTCEECYHIFPACEAELEMLVMRSSRESDDVEDSSSTREESDSDASSDKGDVRANIDVSKAVVNTAADHTAADDDYEAEDLNEAPASWQALFSNEVQPSDSLVVPLLNLVFQVNGSMPALQTEELLRIVAHGAGVNPDQVMLLHSVMEKEMFPGQASSNDLRTVSVGIVSSDVQNLHGILSTSLHSSTNFLEETEAYIADSFSLNVKYVSSAMVDQSVYSMAKLLSREEFQEEMEALQKEEAGTDTALIIGLSAAAGGAIVLTAAAVVVVVRADRKQKLETTAKAVAEKDSTVSIAGADLEEEEEVSSAVEGSPVV
eukprot:CAMPEP_0117670038 /NCGR_PEP_ID=MMETSP0804-20121206/12503_1 /TAXON_ID=1074897 /ORGANISM="Tetraselmis astigmatica, Strain CCMP880" /LENGTH=473 /DNA_ID=CAMNT_0005478237 /DNA_START=52 /DNA_END=1473 /DNA_ORIENTATION=+